MNNKSLVINLLVFGIGVGSGYILGTKTLKKQYQSDLAEVKDFYAKKLDEMGVMPEGFDLNSLDPIDGNEDGEYVEEMSEEYFNKVTKYSSAATTGHGGKGKPIIRYNKPPLEVVAHGALQDLGPEPNQDPDQDSYEPDVHDYEYEAELEQRANELAERRNECMTNGEPYLINHAEYEDTPDEYTRNTLYYYSEDRVLCEDDDSIVDDEESLIGLDYEDILEMQTTAWVRNDNLLNVYQIHRIDQSYARAVTNVSETPREREFRLVGRRKQGMDN